MSFWLAIQSVCTELRMLDLEIAAFNVFADCSRALGSRKDGDRQKEQGIRSGTRSK